MPLPYDTPPSSQLVNGSNFSLPTDTPQAGQVLMWDGSKIVWEDINPFSTSVIQSSDNQVLDLTGLDGDLHGAYLLTWRLLVDDYDFIIYLRWNGGSAGYHGRSFTLYNNLSSTDWVTTRTTWVVMDFPGPGGSSQSTVVPKIVRGHAILHAGRTINGTDAQNQTVSIRCTASRSGDGTGSTTSWIHDLQLFEGSYNVSSPSNLSYLRLIATSGDVIKTGSIFTAQQLNPEYYNIG